MAYILQPGVFIHNSICSRCDLPLQNPERTDFVPGRSNVGGYQQGNPRPAGRDYALNGVIFELRGQAASGTMWPEGDVMRAAGFARSGATGYTLALGNPSLNGATPSGDTVPLAAGEMNLHGQAWAFENAVTDLSFLFRAGEIPIMTMNLLGNIVAADASASSSIRKANAAASVTTGPLPRAWLGSTLSITPAGGSAITDIVVTEYMTALNNRLARRHSAANAYGFAQPDITGRAPSGHVLMEMPPEAVALFEDYANAHTALALQLTYIAGGSSFNTITVSQTVIPSAPVEFVDVNDGHVGYRIPFQQYVDSGPLTFVWS